MPPLVLRQRIPKLVWLSPVSVQTWFGAPRMVRLDAVALEPEQLNGTLEFAPNVFAVIVLFPGVTVSVAELIPHAPLHE